VENELADRGSASAKGLSEKVLFEQSSEEGEQVALLV